MKKITTIMVIGLSALTLAACSAKKGPNGVPVTSAASGSGMNESTQSYAAQAGNNYDPDSPNYYQNPMRAPANQTYYFSFDSSQIRSQDQRALMIQAGFLASHPNSKIRLEGNTDNRGSREYNIALGWRRDQTVARMLEQQGVRPNQIQMVSYGKERPAVTGNNDQAWALNRRVNFIYKAN